ncbi:MAG TPA: hypothetical protein VKH18_03120 [Terriglobales bacterium]|nr:hypothetical protein [Terriglobales bacterium]
MNTLAISGISALMSLVSSSIAAKLYAWPRLRIMERNRALAYLVSPHMFLRFIGLSFLVPGVVSASLPAGFAIPAAYGDLVAGILAILATIALVERTSSALAVVWLFNIWGAADLIFGFYEGGHLRIQPGGLGASFFIVTTVVPALLVSHVLVFRLLVGRETSPLSR